MYTYSTAASSSIVPKFRTRVLSEYIHCFLLLQPLSLVAYLHFLDNIIVAIIWNGELIGI